MWARMGGSMCGLGAHEEVDGSVEWAGIVLTIEAIPVNEQLLLSHCCIGMRTVRPCTCVVSQFTRLHLDRVQILKETWTTSAKRGWPLEWYVLGVETSALYSNWPICATLFCCLQVKLSNVFYNLGKWGNISHILISSSDVSVFHAVHTYSQPH